MRVALIDNYDSFTNNILHALWRCGADVTVMKNDDPAAAEKAAPADAIVLSPGPGHPAISGDIGYCADLLKADGRPILGVCLGHQAMALAAGGRVEKSPVPVHGERWQVLHEGAGLFARLPRPLIAVRYHSFAVTDPVPADFAVDARTPEGVVMAIRHLSLPRWGLQFHPESIDTAAGEALIAAFLREAGGGEKNLPLRVRPVPARAALAKKGRAPLRAAFAHFTAPGSGAALYEDWGARGQGVLLDGARPDSNGRQVSILARMRDPGNAVISYDAAARRLAIAETGGVTHRHGAMEPLLSELTSREVTGLPELPVPFKGGLLGYVTYEGRAALGWDAPAFRDSGPDAAFLYARSFVILDEKSGEAIAICLYEEEDATRAQAFADKTAAALSRLDGKTMPVRHHAGEARICAVMRDGESSYAEKIGRCRRLIETGESYELCLTNTIEVKTGADPWAVHRALRALNPAPYAAFLRLGDITVSSSSPERFFSLSPEGVIEAKPIKGTAGRGTDAAGDALNAARLAASRKDRAENLMITDLLRHDIGAVAEPCSVHVPVLAGIESYETVHQMVSTVRGRARPGLGGLAVLTALFPGGSMTGAPKMRTVALLEALEGSPRGIYSGALGWLSHGGAADMSIVIRSVIATAEGYKIGCGGAITILSDTKDEFAETMLKAQTQIRALALAATGNADAFSLVAEEEARELEDMSS